MAALTQLASAATLPPITLAWNQNPESNIAGYELKYGTTSGTYGTTINAGLNTSTQVSGLSDNVTYYFVVVAYNSAGLRSVPSAQISYRGTTPNQAPNSTISSPSSNTTITAGQTVSFAGSGSDPDGNTPLTYLWNFGSGSGIANSTSQNPGSRQFNNPGTYQVTLTVTDSQGLADPTPAQRTITVTPPVTANQAPDSVISNPFTNATIAAGETVYFTGSGSDPDNNTPLAYLWNFGSGSGIANSTTQNPGSRQFNNPGTYQVTLTVTDSQGLADPTPAQRTITVTPPVVVNQAPDSVISAPASNVTITAGGSVSFTGSGSDPDGNTPLTYLWNFGSGSGISNSTSQNPGSRQFNNVGIFQVTLTVADSNGLSDPTPAQRTVTVTPPVVANQAPNSVISTPASNVTITAGQTVSFAGSGSDPDGNTPLTYLWNFGSGSGISNSTTQNPGSRQFNNPGTYQVTLTVTDSQGLADPTPAQRTITVNAANQAPNSVISAPAANVTITAGQTVSFAGSGSDPDGNTPLTYLWNFGSGSGISNSTAQNPGSRQFNNPGTYQVTLTVTDSKGLADSTPAQRTITVVAPPPANQIPDSMTGGNSSGRKLWLTNGTSQASWVNLATVPTAWQVAGTVDFDRDGQFDILWQNSDTGDRGLWLMDGNNYSSWADLGNVTLDWQIAGSGDFDRDGKPDVLWQNTTTGQCGLWLMNGDSSYTWASLGMVATEWRIVGTGDSNSDGHIDILWHNTSTGQRGLWLMNGASYVSWAPFDYVSARWHAAAAVDFNGDGMPDILRQDPITGDRRLWLMNTTNYSSSIDLGNVPAVWQMTGSGDFNRDNKPDILWQNTATGDCGFWLMNGASYTSWVDLAKNSAMLQTAGAGDFNRDGHTDILWQNSATSERGIWLMNGTTIASTVSLGNVHGDWRIAGAGDFNRDGHTDILWQNNASGQRGIWLMNGTTYTSWVDLGIVATVWRISGTSDFNRDGNIDILWHNVSTGDSVVWLMNGTTNVSWLYLGNTPSN